MDGYGIYARQQVRSKKFRESVKSDLFVTLLSKKLFDVVFILTRFVIVFGHRIGFVLGVCPWPKAFLQTT